MSQVFHGSPNHHIERVIPRRNIRSEKTDRETVIVFDQTSFHASVYRWIALAYLYQEIPGHSMAVDLCSNKREVCITGPCNLEDSLRHLYNSGGYLHTFDATDFWWCEGLGSREVITNKHVSPLEVIFIHDPVLEMKKEGVVFIFNKKSPL